MGQPTQCGHVRTSQGNITAEQAHYDCAGAMKLPLSAARERAIQG